LKRGILEVAAPGTPAVRFELLANRELFVGSSPQSDVRLPEVEGVPPRLLVLQLSEKAVLVRAANDVAASFIYSGQPSREAQLPWGDELYWGPIRFTFLQEASKRGPSAVLLALAAVALMGTGAVVVGAEAATDSLASEPEPPPLFQPATCPDTDAALARQHAAKAIEAARAMAARAPFDRGDGRRALVLFDQASACLRVTQDATEAAKVTAELNSWRQQMEEELSTLRLRLHVALDHRKPGDALGAVRALEALVPEAPPSAYRSYLGDLRRDLERQIARKGQ
jgi:hypothetical protein